MSQSYNESMECIKCKEDSEIINVSLDKSNPSNMNLLSPSELFDKYPKLSIDWTESDLLFFHQKGLFLAKSNEDESSILIVEDSFMNLVDVRNSVLQAKMDILKKNMNKKRDS